MRPAEAADAGAGAGRRPLRRCLPHRPRRPGRSTVVPGEATAARRAPASSAAHRAGGGAGRRAERARRGAGSAAQARRRRSARAHHHGRPRHPRPPRLRSPTPSAAPTTTAPPSSSAEPTPSATPTTDAAPVTDPVASSRTTTGCCRATRTPPGLCSARPRRASRAAGADSTASTTAVPGVGGEPAGLGGNTVTATIVFTQKSGEVSRENYRSSSGRRTAGRSSSRSATDG